MNDLRTLFPRVATDVSECYVCEIASQIKILNTIQPQEMQPIDSELIPKLQFQKNSDTLQIILPAPLVAQPNRILPKTQHGLEQPVFNSC